MSLYNNLVFIILLSEIVAFTILSLPLPSKVRRPLTLTIIKPFQNQKVQTIIKCVIVFILILFVDSINKVYKVELELKAHSITGSVVQTSTSTDRVEIHSRKFLAQRNMYLTGITLFLSFAVVRAFNLVTELLKLKEKYQKSEDKASLEHLKGDEKEFLTKKGDEKDVEEIKLLIEKKNNEIKRLKEKALALQAEIK
ncbi:hypothetical protein TPHA_0B02150 [Tetrapisispora phaffii CBS 4417]|uniref:Endoplasmic reticulum transmembrane protein n=1 Tax=Tetrapisispora phaffii (strain ATCC 24235 / CBS 4417 / NBRC 1672 / NRRL Y-8282 / UCD 70-5) TaxID=1071381 RepID=G8BPF6_TETPH|nr:hypothetical protein TPHA_0B02150 [Tetrapisispora phaffii CBS 4417]CCE61887.1 hypothetical protein TPHA_0B02150 [Tetrapisispora phaffii CBS 4417]